MYMCTIYYYDACTFSKSSFATLLCTRTNTEGVPSSYVEGVPSKPAAAYRLNTFRIIGSPYFYPIVARKGDTSRETNVPTKETGDAIVSEGKAVRRTKIGDISISSITVGHAAISLAGCFIVFQLNKTH